MQKIPRKSGMRYRERIYFNGKPIDSPYFKRMSDARKWKRTKQAEIDNLKALGISAIDNRTFEEYSISWLSKKSHLEPKTIEGYKSVLTKYLYPEFGKIKVREITLQHANLFRSYLINKTELSKVRVNYILKVLKMVFSDATDTGTLLRDPLKPLEYLKVQLEPRVYWLPSEILRFLDSVKDDYYYPLYCFMLNSGVRPTEARGLLWDKVDIEGGRVEISRSLDRHGLKNTTKSKKARWVPMNNLLKELFIDLKANRKCLDYVFTTPKGNHLGMHFGDREFPKAVERAGVRKIQFKHLRSTFASNFVMNRGNIFSLSKILGHSSVVITEQRYADLHPDFMKQEAEIVSFGLKNEAHMKLKVAIDT